MQDDDFRLIPLAEIVEPWMILRVVNRGSVEYLELRDSLGAVGFLNSICVRPCKRKPRKVEVVDGLYRFTAAKDLDLPAAPCIVKYNLTNEDVLAAQIQANALRPETTPVEYARQIKKIMEATPGMRMAELCGRLHKNPEWIAHQLLLLALSKRLQLAVERGEIPLLSAYALARVPPTRQMQFEEQAKTMTVAEFVPMVNAFVKHFKEGVKKGKMDAFLLEDFKPHPHMRLIRDVLAEYDDHQLGALYLTGAQCTTPISAWYLALQWVLHLDAASVAEQRETLLRCQQQKILRTDEDKEKSHDVKPG